MSLPHRSITVVSLHVVSYCSFPCCGVAAVSPLLFLLFAPISFSHCCVAAFCCYDLFQLCSVTAVSLQLQRHADCSDRAKLEQLIEATCSDTAVTEQVGTINSNKNVATTAVTEHIGNEQ